VDYQPPTEGQAAVPATEGPVNPAMTIQPNPAVARVAQAKLATSTDPYLRQYAMAERQSQAQAAEHALAREQHTNDLKYTLAAQVANKLITQEQANMILAQNQKLHDERLSQDKVLHEDTMRQTNKVTTETQKEIAKGHDATILTIAGMKGSDKTEKAKTLKEEGQHNIQELSAQLRDYHTQLKQSGGETSTENSTLGNVGAWMSGSSVGQTVGGIAGTKNQSLRNSVAQQRPLLLQAIMKATGMTAKQMDSNVELKLWLSTATDPEAGYEANMRALDMLEKLYGGGLSTAPPKEPVEPSAPTHTPTAPAQGPATTQKEGWSLQRH
jgi:hypothetical protein